MKEILRTCCVCKTKQNKYNMTRIVNNDNHFIIDNNKQVSGKASYVCNNTECKDILIKKKLLNRAFKANFGDCAYKNLSEELNIATDT